MELRLVYPATRLVSMVTLGTKGGWTDLLGFAVRFDARKVKNIVSQMMGLNDGDLSWYKVTKSILKTNLSIIHLSKNILRF